MTLERLSNFRVKQSSIELIALNVLPKNSNHLRSLLRAIMALDHSRLGLENKSGGIFLRPTSLLYITKSCQQIWVRVNQPFVLFIHHIKGERVLWGVVFIIQTSDKIQYFTIFQDKLHTFNQFRTTRSTRGLLTKPFKKFPKSTIRPTGSHFWQASNLEWTLKELPFNIIKNVLCLFLI